LVKPNYNFAKRQRELAKKAKKEEKAARKAAGLPELEDAATPDGDDSAADAEATPPNQPPGPAA
jgi:hypothetical protein